MKVRHIPWFAGLALSMQTAAAVQAPLDVPPLPQITHFNKAENMPAAEALALKQAQNPKLDSMLNRYLMQQKGTLNEALPNGIQMQTAPVAQDGSIEVVVRAAEQNTDAVRALVGNLGGEVSYVYKGLLFTRIPGDKLENLAASSMVQKVRVPSQASPMALSEGVAFHHADDVHALGATGKGRKVGILDCGGFSNYQGLLGSDLPANVTVWDKNNNGDPTDDVGTGVHGTACAEIVHDMAPEAQIFIAHDATEAEYFQGMDWMAQQGVDVVSYSCGWMGPYPNDGQGLPYNPVNQRASDMMTQDNVLVVASAGNAADGETYVHSYEESPQWSDYHQFDNGIDWSGPLNPIYLASGVHYITLSWDDWPADPTQSGSNQDYDLELYGYDPNLGGFYYLGWSGDWQSGAVGEIPFEQLVVYIPPGFDG